MKEFFKTNYLLFIKIILTIYILYALKYLFFLKKIEVHFYTNIAFIFIVFGVAYLVNYTLNTIKNGIDKRLAIIGIIMGLYFTFVLILGSFYEGIGLVRVPKQYIQYNDYTLEQFIQSLPYIPALWFMCFGIILSIYLKLPELFNPILKNKIKLPDKYNSLYKIWLFIFICWLPYFILLYPGFVGPDPIWQINQVFSGKFYAHHPLLATFAHYFTYTVYKITDNGLLTMALYVLIIQMLPFSFASAYMLYNIKKVFKVNDLIYILMILFCALYPLQSLCSIYIEKDVLFYILFILFITDTIILVYLPKLLQKKSFMVKYIIIAIIFCLTRNNMVYALIFAFPLILMLAKNYRKKILFLFSIIFIGFLVLNTSMIKISNAVKGDFRESLSLPMQQLARVYKYHKDNLSDDEKNYIENIIKIDALKRYRPNISDPVKAFFKTKHFLTVESIKNYVEIGLKYPTTYLNSVLIMSSPIWNLFYKSFFNWSFLRFWDLDIDKLQLTKKDTIQPKNKVVHQYINNVPYIAVNSSFVYFYIYNQSLYFYILIFTFIYFIYKKVYKNIIILLIPLVYTLTVLLGPLVYIRYTYYLYAMFPIIIMMLTNRNNSKMIANTGEK